MNDDITDRDFIEDSDSEEEFDKKFEDSIVAYKESSRPSSSSSRPKTASRHRDDTESRTNLIATAALQIYFRISKFISSKRLSKSQIFAQFGEYLTAEKFKENFSLLGYELSEAEVSFIFRDSGVPRSGVIRMGDIYDKLIAEVKEDEEETPRKLKASNTESLRKEAEKLLQDPIHKHFRSFKKTRGKSVKSMKRPSSSSSRVPRPPSACSTMRKESYMRNYLRESKAKNFKEKTDLNTTVDRCRREFEYECVKKMGEANEILAGMSSNTTYRCIRKSDKSLMCHIYIKEEFVEEISMENFTREWKRLKKKKPVAVVEPSVSQITSKNASTTNAKVNKAERQEELKKLLLETRELTISLKQQLKVLEQKGIVRRSNKKDASIVIKSKG